MQPQNLGQLLAQNIEREKVNSAATGLARAQREGEEAVEKYRKVEDFFSKARAKLTNNILAGLTGKDLTVTLGRTSRTEESFSDVASILETYRYTATSNFSDMLARNRSYGALWLEFQSWANSAGLDVSWNYCWDGGAEFSWHVLSVKPRAAHAR